jgi:hypothetical protein
MAEVIGSADTRYLSHSVCGCRSDRLLEFISGPKGDLLGGFNLDGEHKDLWGG